MDDHTPTGSADPMDSVTTPASPTPPPMTSDDSGLGAGSAPAAPRRSARKPAKRKAAAPKKAAKKAARKTAGKRKTAARKTAGKKKAGRKSAARGRSQSKARS